ncbi:hypothetical protein K402DRAFT_462066 [Aulographum hederae CBS 113979]|uniref:Uncharacterized protein n=1 Tax=Aulographum hederae CBS 113979 TaxID=1176131 RepID=A0A6G1H577_9PEZI|nr:hypothetical protein K402DRAFT_462066 [Aulographum hederae CBS 113979]
MPRSVMLDFQQRARGQASRGGRGGRAGFANRPRQVYEAAFPEVMARFSFRTVDRDNVSPFGLVLSPMADSEVKKMGEAIARDISAMFQQHTQSL